MKQTITRTALLVLGLALLGGGCAGPTVDDEVASERPAKLRKKPIAGLVNPRFETDDAMLAASELLLSADPFWARFGELGWLDDARLEHREILTETGPAYSRYNVNVLFLESGLGVPLSRSDLRTPGHGALSLVGGDEEKLSMQNPLPVYLEYASGDPHFTRFPMYADPTKGAATDGKTLRWNPEWFDRELRPATLGAALLAQVLWARRLLWIQPGAGAPAGEAQGGGDASPWASGPEDRAFGRLLVRLATHKVHALATALAYDWTRELMVRIPNGYRPEETGEPFVYYPHAAMETRYLEPDRPHPGEPFRVTDEKSYLWDQALLLRALLEFIDFAQPARGAGTRAALPPPPAALDPTPRPPASAVREAKAVANLLVRNILGMHYRPEAHSLVSFARGWERGEQLRIRDAGLALVAFEMYLAQPWANERLREEVRRVAGEQSRFLMRYQYYDGAFADQVEVATGDSVEPRGFHLVSQAWAIRGMLAGFRVTGDFLLRRGAWRCYRYMEETLWAPTHKLYRVEDLVAKGQKFNVITPLVFASTVGALRELALETRDFSVVERMVDLMTGITNAGLQLSELQATGENYGEEWDFDDDGILKPQFAAVPFGLAPVFASQVLVYIPSTGHIIPPQE